MKLIERDARRARRISELLENAIVLHGDAADEELLIEENIDSADVFAALTNSEEANILSAMLAKRLGAAQGHGAHQQALLHRADGERQHRHRHLAADHHHRLAARARAPRRRGARALAAARRGRGLEAIVHGDERSSRVVGRMVSEIPLPEGASIGAIVRGDAVIMAHHDTVVRADDHVILFLSDRRHLEAVEKLFLRAAR